MTEQETVRAPCGHTIYGENDHCAVMECPNYINRCINHNVAVGDDREHAT